MVRQLETIKGLNPRNFLIVLQFNQLILKYGTLNSGEVNVESASKDLFLILTAVSISLEMYLKHSDYPIKIIGIHE